MSKFLHQGFLQRFPYEGIDLSKHRIEAEECAFYLDYREQTALSDIPGKLIRTIRVKEVR